MRRFDRVLDVQQAFAVEDPRYHSAIRAQIGGHVVGHLGGQARRAGMRDQKLHALQLTQRERLGQDAARHETGLARQAAHLRDQDACHGGVIDERRDDEHRAQQEEQKQDGSRDQGCQQPRLREERHAAGSRPIGAG